MDDLETLRARLAAVVARIEAAAARVAERRLQESAELRNRLEACEARRAADRQELDEIAEQIRPLIAEFEESKDA